MCVDEERARLSLLMPVSLPEDFDPYDLFDPQHHIELREGLADSPAPVQPSVPVGISLLLARQLLEEAPLNGNVKPERAPEGLYFKICLPLHTGD